MGQEQDVVNETNSKDHCPLSVFYLKKLAFVRQEK